MSDLAAECNGCFDIGKALDAEIAIKQLLQILHATIPSIRSLGDSIVKHVHLSAQSSANPRISDRVARYWGSDCANLRQNFQASLDD